MKKDDDYNFDSLDDLFSFNESNKDEDDEEIDLDNLDFDFDSVINDEDENKDNFKEKEKEVKPVEKEVIVTNEEVEDKTKENANTETVVDLKQEDDELLDYLIKDTSKEVYLNFNNLYKEYKSLKDKDNLTDEEKNRKLNLMEQIGKTIAVDFNFNDEEVKNRKDAYVNFAMGILKEGADKPNYSPLCILYYAQGLYGRTNLAQDLSTKEKQKENITLGNKYVKSLEKNTSVHSLKAYGLTLRAYAYIMMGDSLDLEPGVKLKNIYNDLIYSVTWDTNSYLARYALGLCYLNEYADYYSVSKAEEQFNMVIDLEDRQCDLDNYISKEEKQRIISLAKKRLAK